MGSLQNSARSVFCKIIDLIRLLVIVNLIFQQDKKEFPVAFSSDIDFLKEVRTAVLENLKCSPITSTSEVSYGRLPDQRPMRRVFPRGREHLISLMSKRDTLYFVGFIGFTKDADELDENIKEDIWNIDNKFVEQLSGHSNIVGYFSAEQLDGHNWGNLVVCKSSDAIKEWMTSKTHTTAIT